jgi:hypothetical protein
MICTLIAIGCVIGGATMGLLVASLCFIARDN